MHSPYSEPAKERIALYDAQNIDSCPWPETEDGQYARRYLTPFIKKGTAAYIENVKTDLRVLICGPWVLPVTINESDYDNSYVCSPYSYYISYGRQSLELLTNGGSLHPVNGLLWGAEKVLRLFQINKVVVVNNWFYSTNLYPPLDPQQLHKITEFLLERLPDYAVIFRSVDPQTNSGCFDHLQKMGYNYIASRQIYFINPQQSTLFESRLFKSDRKLLDHCGYEILDGDQLTEKDLPRLRELYSDLYLHKYSNLNPRYNEAFLSLALTQNLIRFKALKKEGRIDGVVGFIERYGKLFCPIFGYDQSVPKEVALYRLLSTVLMLEAGRNHLLFHESSGASMFKTIRKAQSCIEYMAVYFRHLPLKRRIPWILLEKMSNSIGIFYMKKY